MVNIYDVRRIVAMYVNGHTATYIAQVIGCSRTTVHNILVKQGVPIRQSYCNRKPVDPSPEEIEQATAVIRSTWGVLEERIRRDVVPYDLPVYSSKLERLC